MNRLKRQTMIKRLVTENEIHTQSELLALLEKENIHTTQATISRDIRELNLNKVDNGQGEAYYRILNNSALRPKYKTDEERKKEQLIQAIREVVTKVERVAFLLVVHTLPDNATLFSAVLDEVSLCEKKCSVAGFDTVIIVSSSEEKAQFSKTLYSDFRELLAPF